MLRFDFPTILIIIALIMLMITKTMGFDTYDDFCKKQFGQEYSTTDIIKSSIIVCSKTTDGELINKYATKEEYEKSCPYNPLSLFQWKHKC